MLRGATRMHAAGLPTSRAPAAIMATASPIRAGVREAPVNGSGHSPGMVISENANGLAPGLATVMRTVRTPVRSTLALKVMEPSALVVRVVFSRVASLAALTKAASSLVCLGSSYPVAWRVPQLTRARSRWRWSGWATAGPAPSRPRSSTAPATGETLSQRMCLPSDESDEVRQD